MGGSQEKGQNISNKKDMASSGKPIGSLLLREDRDRASPSGSRECRLLYEVSS